MRTTSRARSLLTVVAVSALAIVSFQLGRANERSGADSPFIGEAEAQSQEPLISPTAPRVTREGYYPNS